MKSYPYVGEGKNRLKYLVLSGGNGFILPCLNYANGKVVTNLNTSPECMKNITREYLEGKCVKIESPEHSEFIIKLAENAEFMQYEGDFTGNYKNGDFLFFYGDNDITCAHGNTKGWEEITIPLPPKPSAVSKVNRDIEREVWKVGDIVTWGCAVDNGEIKAISDNLAWIKNKYGAYLNVKVGNLEKPKTQAEILRECVWDTVSEYIEKESIIDAITTDLIDNYNITKKPQ